jgi:hypothetical protein
VKSFTSRSFSWRFRCTEREGTREARQAAELDEFIDETDAARLASLLAAIKDAIGPANPSSRKRTLAFFFFDP